jgi:FMN phosphatase YigB (HAD superfamily)
MRLMKRRAIIVDLDGTLCNKDWRQHLYDKENRNWNEINKAAEFDQPHEWCMEIVRLFAMQNYKIIFLTGRSATKDSKGVTERWLMTHVGPGVDYELLMRPARDHRDDTVVKSEIYCEKIAPLYDVLFAVDDRLPVVQMWRDIGVACLDCASNP